MVLFEITPDIQKQAEPANEGWHPMVVKSIKEKLSNAGDKMILFTFEITGPMIENPNINDKGKYAFNNVNLAWIHYSLDFLSALVGKDLRKNTGKFYTTVEDANKALKGKPYEGYVKIGDYEGRKTSNIDKLRAVGAGRKTA